MYQLNYDAAKNRFYMKAIGVVKLEEAVNLRQDMTNLIQKQAKPGFTVLVDMREGGAMPPDSMIEINKIREYGVKMGLRKSALISSSKIVEIQVKRTTQQVENYQQPVFASQEEAEAYLDAK